MKLSIALFISFLTTGVSVAQDQAGESEKYFPQQLTAKDLSFYCASSSLTDRGRHRQRYCSGFVSGVEEAVRLLGQHSPSSQVNRICVPKGSSAHKFVDVYIKYAVRKTTDLKKPAALVVMEALQDGYPCDR